MGLSEQTQDRGAAADGFEVGCMSMEAFRQFREMIHRATGIWLRDGKQVMLSSRLARRLRHHAMSSFSEYYRYVCQVQDGGRELAELINCVTTNKTSFFREEHHFAFLAERLLPERRRAAQTGAPRTIRIWSAACSTGEEAYSIVIALREALGPECAQWKLEVIASDIDTTVLARARAGVYDTAALEPVSPGLHSRYFLRGVGGSSGQVRVKPEVMQPVSFQRLNLMDPVWPIEGRFDAIFFRNALIYFKQETQERFLRKMVGYLNSKAYLLLGHSEHVPWLYDVVLPLPKTVYQLRS
jgi:chemotaxis protein methyltransferase CheR